MIAVDSAALITDTMANGHEDFNPLGQRLFCMQCIEPCVKTPSGIRKPKKKPR